MCNVKAQSPPLNHYQFRSSLSFLQGILLSFVWSEFSSDPSLNSDGFQSKKSLVFSPEDLKDFIVDAPNITYLAIKVKRQKNSYFVRCCKRFLYLLFQVVFIFGVTGACRGDKNTEPKEYVICRSVQYFVGPSSRRTSGVRVGPGFGPVGL